MSQGNPSNLSTRLHRGGTALLYSHPISRGNTFKPSGNPATDPHEMPRMTDDEWTRRLLGIDTAKAVMQTMRDFAKLLPITSREF
jgi:hypothetical protein